MKNFFSILKHFIFSICLILSASFFPSVGISQSDTALDDQRAACSKNSASVWDAALNRCVQKKEAQAARHEVEDCAAITDLEQRKACHKKIAEQKTGLNSDIDSLPQGTTNQSAIMNGFGTAYAILGMINGLGVSKKTSQCTSKKIFGYTAMAGTLTDIWLKIKAKNAMDELKDKYQLGVKNNAYDNQSKAFEYLKAEQETVKEIASREKKRNMLLMAGYGAATAMALYEIFAPAANPQCYAKEPEEKKPETCGADQVAGTDGKCGPKPPVAEAPAGCGADQVAGADGKCGAKPTPVATAEEPPKKEPVPATPDKKIETAVVAQPAEKPEVKVETKDKFVVSGSDKSMRVVGVDEAGKPNGTSIITHDGKSYIVQESTGKVLGPVNTDKIDVSWKSGSKSPIPASLIRNTSSTSASTINFSGKTDMKVDTKTFKIKH